MLLLVWAHAVLNFVFGLYLRSLVYFLKTRRNAKAQSDGLDRLIVANGICFTTSVPIILIMNLHPDYA